MEFGYIRASWSQETDGVFWIFGAPPNEVPGYLPLTAKVTLVNRARQPVGRTAGAAFSLPGHTDLAFYPNDHEISEFIQLLRSETLPGGLYTRDSGFILYHSSARSK